MICIDSRFSFNSEVSASELLEDILLLYSMYGDMFKTIVCHPSQSVNNKYCPPTDKRQPS